MLSSRPYLVRAVNEWIVDSGYTPHILAEADAPGLDVPDMARQEGKVVLNISPSAVRDLLIDSDLVTFVARFGGVSRAVSVPIAAVRAVYARENGQGMMFPDDEDLSEADQSAGSDLQDDDQAGSGTRRPNLRVIK